MFWRRKRGVVEARVVPSIPDWADLADVVSGRVWLADAPPIDVSGVDVLGQGTEEEGDVGRLGGIAVSYFGGSGRAVVGESLGEQLLLPPPPAVSDVGVGVPARVSLFGPDPDDDDDEDEDEEVDDG